MSDDKIDIGPEIAALCEKLGLTGKEYVREIVVKPMTVTATVFRGKDGPYTGSMFIDLKTGAPAIDVLEFAVST